MYTPDRELNPPSFYERDVDTTEKDNARDLWKEALATVEVIRNSKSIVYNVFGGEIQREKDLDEAETIAENLYNNYINL